MDRLRHKKDHLRVETVSISGTGHKTSIAMNFEVAIVHPKLELLIFFDVETVHLDSLFRIPFFDRADWRLPLGREVRSTFFAPFHGPRATHAR